MDQVEGRPRSVKQEKINFRGRRPTSGCPVCNLNTGSDLKDCKAMYGGRHTGQEITKLMHKE